MQLDYKPVLRGPHDRLMDSLVGAEVFRPIASCLVSQHCRVMLLDLTDFG
jgi:hypothetical protein